MSVGKRARNRNHRQDTEIEFKADETLEWWMRARAVPTSGAQDILNTTKANVNAKGIDLFSLPILWSLVSKISELRRWSKFLPDKLTGPLKSLSEWVLCDFLRTIPADQCKSNKAVKVVECTASNNCGHSAHFLKYCKDDVVPPVVFSAIQDIGIPGLCRDIVYLLIDDVLHMSEERVHRYFRVWSSSGAVMLVSSTTDRHFDSTGILIEVQLK
jgi:hypothetical protein